MRAVARWAAGLVVTLVVAACGASEPEKAAMTWSQYEQVAPGMTYAQVVSLLGQPGRQLATHEINGKIVRTYGFGNSDGTFFVHFDGDVVGGKTSGLLQAPALNVPANHASD